MRANWRKCVASMRFLERAISSSVGGFRLDVLQFRLYGSLHLVEAVTFGGCDLHQQLPGDFRRDVPNESVLSDLLFVDQGAVQAGA